MRSSWVVCDDLLHMDTLSKKAYKLLRNFILTYFPDNSFIYPNKSVTFCLPQGSSKFTYEAAKPYDVKILSCLTGFMN